MKSRKKVVQRVADAKLVYLRACVAMRQAVKGATDEEIRLANIDSLEQHMAELREGKT